MSKVIPLVPRVKVDAESNLKAFVARARNKLTTFGANLDFDADRWNLTDYYLSRGDRSAKTSSIWLNFKQRKATDKQSLCPQILDFSKAYVRNECYHTSSSDAKRCVTAFRALDAAIREYGIKSLVDCDAGTFNRASEFIRAWSKIGEDRSAGLKLAVIARFMDEHGLVYAPLHNWKYIPLSRQTSGRIGAEFERRRQKNLPSDESLDAMAQAFHLATEPRDVLVTSIAAIFCAAPERINELMALPNDCEIEQTGSDGKTYLGLRWLGSKGAKDHIKWIIPGMADVVNKALANIRAITDSTRKIALWYENNSQKLYLPPHLEHLRKKSILQLEDIWEIANLYPDKRSVRTWMAKNDIPYTFIKKQYPKRGSIRIMAAKFKDIERYIVSTLPKGFPIHDERSGLKYSDALFTIPRGLFSNRSNSGGEPCMFEYIKYHHICCAFGYQKGGHARSVFERLGLDPDGKLSIRSHQFRHWLNTLAQSANLSQVDIAKWSGRASVHQNSVYDHVSSEEIVSYIRDAVGDHTKAIGPIAEIPKNLPVSRTEFAAMTVLTAHVTLYGFCIHDYTTTPCEMFRACLDCREHVCIKGLPDKTERIRDALEAARNSLEKAIAAAADEVYGAEEWVVTHQATVSRLEELLAILLDPAISEGAIVQLTSTNTYSLSDGAVSDRIQLDGAANGALSSTSEPGSLS
ncbi:hypothetical protein [Burkholderia cepacia]|uniref:hypothetical protein n=1 Tax=Burkholderia cepacia TaxID=292 RepID=UPI003D67B130